MTETALSVQSISTKDIEDSIQIDISDKLKTSQIKSTVHELFAKSCPTRNVTVFQDRAEVNRIVKVDAEIGDVEVVIRQLPLIIQKDSVRVTCYTENVTIVEVAFLTKSIIEKQINEEEENLKAESESEKVLKRIKALNKEKSVLLEKLKRNEKEISIIDSYASCITEKKEDKVGEILDKKSIESMLNFLSIYKDRSEKITDSNSLLNESLDLVNKEIVALTDNLNRIHPLQKEYREESCISILLDVKKNTNVSLVVSYVVHPFASWTPFYDVRAFSKDNSVQILYFANVCQSTGEDWTDCKIALSTALPSVGGSPPELLPHILDLQEPYRIQKKVKRSSFRGMGTFLKTAQLEDDNLEIKAEKIVCLAEPCMSMPVAKATDGMTSTSFEITRLTSIPSDCNNHKVSICQLDFSPQFEYMATPKSVAHAFLKVKAKNDSAYALLSGYANVFLDNNFLTRSYLPAVSPMEEFEIALGVDPAVKVTYKPLRKFQQTSGIISKFQVYDFHQQIEVKNTKRDVIKIKITDQCPRSTNDKIKVILQEPEIKIPKSSSNEPSLITHDNVTFYTSDYKLEWVLEIASNETKIINLRYQIEHPVGTIVRGLSL